MICHYEVLRELIMTDNNKENGDTDIKKKSHTLRPLGKNNIWWPKNIIPKVLIGIGNVCFQVKQIHKN